MMLKVSTDSVLYVKKLLDFYNDEEESESVAFEPKNKQEECLKKLCQKLFTRQIHKRSEATFINHHLMPFLESILLDGADDSITYSIDGSEAKKKKKPDFMLGIEDRKRDIYYFYAEVKRPNIQSVHQVEEDYVKLLKQMKSSIDSQACLGMASPVSFGLLCEGFSCYLYKMKILEEGIYTSYCLRHFCLVEDQSMLLNLIPAFEAFWLVKEELEPFQDRYKARSKEEKRALQELIKKSFITKFSK